MCNFNSEEYVKEASILLKNKTIEQVKSFFLLYFVAIYDKKVELKEWRNFRYHQDIFKIKEEAKKEINNYLFENWNVSDEEYKFVNWHKTYTKMYFKEDILGKIYLIYSKDTNRKKMGEHYTREDIVKYIFSGLKKSNILEKRMIDPCCGSGNFLVEFLRLGLKKCHNQKEKEILVNKLFKREFIVGIDIQEIPYIISSIRILLEVLINYGSLNPHYKVPILQKDTLKNYDICENNKFDLVITNPPYLRYQLIDQEDRKLFAKEYFSAIGRFDLYVLFIEKCINLAKDDGEIIIVTSDKFMSADYGKNIRKLISEENKLIKVQDLRNIFAFEASVLSAIYYIKKVKSNKSKVVWEKIMENQKKFHVIKQGNIILGDTWKYTNKEILEIVKKINNLPNIKKISEICNISIGIQTTADKVFCEKNSERKFMREKIEENLLYPLIRGKTINKWRIGKQYPEFRITDRILYPYVEKKNETKVIDLECYQYARSYLYKYKYDLEKRKYMGSKNWYEHLSPKSFKSLKELKIVTPDLSSKCKFALDANGFFCNGTVYFIKYLTQRDYEDYLYLLAILNSNLIEFIHKNINTVHLASNKYRFQTSTIKNYPIILLDKNNNIYSKMVVLVKQILEKNDIDFLEIEKKINDYVYQIYNLKNKEIKVIKEFLIEY